MTTELTKAAQQALEALDEIHAGKRHPQLALAVAHNLRRALTQRPAAQTEDDVFMPRRLAANQKLTQLGYHYDSMQGQWLPVPQQATTSGWVETSAPPQRLDWSDTQQATPEPLIVKGAMAGMVDAQVRDLWPTKGATPEPVVVVHQIRGDTFDCPHAWRDATEEAFYATPAADRRILYTRPAPGVPEGFALVPVEPTPEMKAEGIKVEVYSEASDSIGALTWAEVAAIYRAMLAAAQAKGAGHE